MESAMFGQVSSEERKVVNCLIQRAELEGTVSMQDIAQDTGKDIRDLQFILEDLENTNHRCIRGFGYGPSRFSLVQVLAPAWYYADAEVAGFDVLGTMLRVARVIIEHEQAIDRDQLLQETGLLPQQLDIATQILGTWNLVSLFQPSVRGLAFKRATATAQTYRFLA